MSKTLKEEREEIVHRRVSVEERGKRVKERSRARSCGWDRMSRVRGRGQGTRYKMSFDSGKIEEGRRERASSVIER